MTLLIIVAALLVGYFAQWPQRLRDFTWYLQHLGWLSGRFDLRGAWGLLVALALPVVVVVLLQGLLARGPGLVLGTVFAWLVLLGSLGPGNLLAAVNDYMDALDAEDEERSSALQNELLGTHADEQHPLAVGIVSRAHDEYFAVIFWFAILGPVGAVLYRFTRQIAQLESHDQLRPAAEHLLGVLGWPSTRLTAFGFALMGHFDKALLKLTGAIAWQTDLLSANRHLLADVICAALDLEPQIDSPIDVARRVRDLILRTLTLWLVVFAVLTLLGW